MEREHSRWKVRLAAACVLVPLAACVPNQRRVGRAPEGTRRVRTDEILNQRRGKGAQKGVEQAETDAHRAARNLSRERQLDAAADTIVIGAYGTKVYHLPRCEELHVTPQGERITFTSPFDGLDDGYRPCNVCEPGP